MKYTIKCVTSLDKDGIILDADHIYHYKDLKSDTSVSKLYSDSVYFSSPEFKTSAEVGTKLHKMLENNITEYGFNNILSPAEVLKRVKSISNSTSKEFLIKVLLCLNELDNIEHIQMHPEVKLFALIKDADETVLRVGGSIDLLVSVFVPGKILFYIFDLKTGKYNVNHDRQVATYELLLKVAGHKNVKSMCLYSGNEERKYCTLSEKTFEEAVEKAFKKFLGKEPIEIKIEASDDTETLEQLNELYEEKKRELEEIEKRRKMMIQNIMKPYENVKNGTFFFTDNLKYTITTYQRKSIDESLVSERCPEAIKFKEQTTTRLINME